MMLFIEIFKKTQAKSIEVADVGMQGNLEIDNTTKPLIVQHLLTVRASQEFCLASSKTPAAEHTYTA